MCPKQAHIDRILNLENPGADPKAARSTKVNLVFLSSWNQTHGYELYNQELTAHHGKHVHCSLAGANKLLPAITKHPFVFLLPPYDRPHTPHCNRIIRWTLSLQWAWNNTNKQDERSLNECRQMATMATATTHHNPSNEAGATHGTHPRARISQKRRAHGPPTYCHRPTFGGTVSTMLLQQHVSNPLLPQPH